MYNQDSILLQKCLTPIYEKYQEIQEKKIFLSKISQIFIEKIIQWIEDSEKSFEKIEIDESILDKTNELPKGKYYYHIPYKIKHHIENMNWVGKKYTFPIKNRIFTIYCIHPTDSFQTENKIYKWFESIKKYIYSWLYIACMQSNEECSKNMNIYLYFNDFKKQFPEKKEVLGENHINTAYTFACKINENGNNEMYLYRKEEWFKVFIHETFHSFSLDFSNINNNMLKKIDKQIMQIFPLHLDVRFYETYTESWAEILNIIYVVYFSQTNKKMSKIIECLKMEQIYSLFQMIKILKYNEISYNELYENNEKAKMKRIYNYKEYTPVFSYYILKCICMMNVGEFIEWSYITNRRSLSFTNHALSNIEINMNLFVEFIKKRYNKTHFLRGIKHMENYYDLILNHCMNNKTNTKTNKNMFFILHNLRMSMFTLQ
jgi:hypothetical protein